MLEGDTAGVIRTLRAQAVADRLKGARRASLKRTRGYLEEHIPRMAYDVYLEHGFPIASGIIEGACRCVIKDRIERSGMRWIMPGAQAMLALRCRRLSDLWEPFMTFRIRHETQRLYPARAANNPVLKGSMAA